MKPYLPGLFRTSLFQQDFLLYPHQLPSVASKLLRAPKLIHVVYNTAGVREYHVQGV